MPLPARTLAVDLPPPYQTERPKREPLPGKPQEEMARPKAPVAPETKEPRLTEGKFIRPQDLMGKEEKQLTGIPPRAAGIATM